MGTPVNNNTNPSKSGCTFISSNCVIWHGPDIPCIDLCQGDSITDVVYKLATLLCEISEGIINLSELDVDCILNEGQEPPETNTELLQIIIDKICYIQDNCCGEEPEPEPTPETLPLSECLWYKNEEGELVTALPRDEYIQFLATVICNGLTLITQLNEYYTSINARLTDLEETVEECCNKEPEDITIITQCLSGAEPGEEKEISEAFEYLEARVCEYLALFGSVEAVKDFQCEGLNTSPQLSDITHMMNELEGWVSNPATLADSLTNLWLTVCDMRARVIECCLGAEPCALVPVSNVQITDVTESGSIITWDAPNTPYTEAPIEYYYEIWEWDGIQNVGGAPIDLGTTTDLYYEISSVPDVDKYYAIYISAVYETCDPPVSGSVAAYGYIIQPTYTKCITITDTIEGVEGECDGTPYSYDKHTVTATLRNYATQQIMVNSGTPITISLLIDVYDNCTEEGSQETMFVVIPTGMSSGSNIFYNGEETLCGTCKTTDKTLNCVSSISDIQTTICPDSLIEECLY